MEEEEEEEKEAFAEGRILLVGGADRICCTDLFCGGQVLFLPHDIGGGNCF